MSGFYLTKYIQHIFTRNGAFQRPFSIDPTSARHQPVIALMKLICEKILNADTAGWWSFLTFDLFEALLASVHLHRTFRIISACIIYLAGMKEYGLLCIFTCGIFFFSGHSKPSIPPVRA